MPTRSFPATTPGWWAKRRIRRWNSKARRPSSTRRSSPGLVAARVPCGADDGIRTRDPHLGKVVLYQLSHVRATLILSRGAIGGERQPSAPRRTEASISALGWRKLIGPL